MFLLSLRLRVFNFFFVFQTICFSFFFVSRLENQTRHKHAINRLMSLRPHIAGPDTNQDPRSPRIAVTCCQCA